MTTSRSAKAYTSNPATPLRSAGRVTAELHVGVEEPFAHARKAHPAFVFPSLQVLEEVVSRLGRLGFDLDRSEWNTFAGYHRVHVNDAHANRVELLA